MDTVTSERRSLLMGRVKGRDTKPELLVRRMLHRMGFRFRLHRADLPGKPDIVLPKFKVAIFVHGCFWHGHSCKRGARPTSNVDFWTSKLDRNLERDRTNLNALKKLGWKCLVLWQCQLTKTNVLERKVAAVLKHRKVKI